MVIFKKGKGDGMSKWKCIFGVVGFCVCAEVAFCASVHESEPLLLGQPPQDEPGAWKQRSVREQVEKPPLRNKQAQVVLLKKDGQCFSGTYDVSRWDVPFFYECEGIRKNFDVPLFDVLRNEVLKGFIIPKGVMPPDLSDARFFAGLRPPEGCVPKCFLSQTLRSFLEGFCTRHANLEKDLRDGHGEPLTAENLQSLTPPRKAFVWRVEDAECFVQEMAKARRKSTEIFVFIPGEKILHGILEKNRVWSEIYVDHGTLFYQKMIISQQSFVHTYVFSKRQPRRKELTRDIGRFYTFF